MAGRSSVAVLLAAGLLPAAVVAEQPTTTGEIREIRAGGMSTGGNGLLAYTAAHEINSIVPKGAVLPPAVIEASDHPQSFTAVSVHGGELGAWVRPEGAGTQFSPASRLIENAYYTNELRSDPNTVELEPGDHAEFALAHVDGDALIPPDRERGSTDGELAWDVATDVRQVRSRFGGVEAELDVVFVRADIVARGGDVDARRGPLELPPLEIDLPRVYLEPVSAVGLAGMVTPFLEYVPSFGITVEPHLGKAVIKASAAGYLPEAREHTLSNGRVVREWHLPITATFIVGRQDSLPGVASMTAPTAGRAAVTEGSRQLDVPAGATVQAVSGTLPAILGAQEPAGSAQAGGTTAVDEVDDLAAAALIDRTLSSPVDLDLSSGVRVTVDPDHDSSGVLALLDAEREGDRWAEAVALPYAVVDGVAVRLDRSRLTDLRVGTRYPTVTLRTTLGASPAWPPDTVITNRRFGTSAGLFVEAVYDLGGDLRAFVELRAVPGVGTSTRLVSSVAFRRLSRQPFTATAVHYLVPSGSGEVLFDGEPQVHEFTTEKPGELRQGPRRITGAMGAHDGRFTVLQSDGTLPGPDAEPDPAVRLDEGPVTVLYRATAPRESAGHTSTTRIILDDPLPGPAPDPEPPPFAMPCLQPHVAGSVDALVPDTLDITEAWLDADSVSLYASVRVRDLPGEALPASTNRYSLHWRWRHVTHYARTSLDDAGKWTWEAGTWGSLGFQPLADDRITGEVRLGAEGVLRIAIPRDLFTAPLRDGALLRDLGAHAFFEPPAVPATPVTNEFGAHHHADAEPGGASLRFGAGEDFTVGACEATN